MLKTLLCPSIPVNRAILMMGVFCIMLIGGLGLSSDAHAIEPEPVIVYDNGDLLLQSTCNFLGPEVYAEDFVLVSDTTVTQVHFFAIDNTWDGNLEYWFLPDSRNDGSPGLLPVAQGNGINISSSVIAENVDGRGRDLLKFSFDLESPLPLEKNTTYWLGLPIQSH